MPINQMLPLKVRLAFQKFGRAKFLSHLDTMRVFAAALKRAELPLRYTEGFNPHIVLSIALPLGVGVESYCERLDFGITSNISCGSLPNALNKVLPEGFRAVSATVGGRKIDQIAFVKYAALIDTTTTPEKITELLTTSAIVSKRSKKKDFVPTDIVPFIRALSCERGDTGGKLQLTATLSAKDPVLNPEYVAEAVRKYLDPEASLGFARLEILDKELSPFDRM